MSACYKPTPSGDQYASRDRDAVQQRPGEPGRTGHRSPPLQTRKRPREGGVFTGQWWCRREDLNLHVLADTRLVANLLAADGAVIPTWVADWVADRYRPDTMAAIARSAQVTAEDASDRQVAADLVGCWTELARGCAAAWLRGAGHPEQLDRSVLGLLRAGELHDDELPRCLDPAATPRWIEPVGVPLAPERHLPGGGPSRVVGAERRQGRPNRPGLSHRTPTRLSAAGSSAGSSALVTRPCRSGNHSRARLGRSATPRPRLAAWTMRARRNPSP
jgi:hypothetical protein